MKSFIFLKSISFAQNRSKLFHKNELICITKNRLNFFQSISNNVLDRITNFVWFWTALMPPKWVWSKNWRHRWRKCQHRSCKQVEHSKLINIWSVKLIFSTMNSLHIFSGHDFTTICDHSSFKIPKKCRWFWNMERSPDFRYFFVKQMHDSIKTGINRVSIWK